MDTNVKRLVAFSILLLNIWSANSICPYECKCSLDDMGRRKVSCDKGGMVGPLDITQVEANTEVLEITAPEDNMNSLMIGPIFSGFTKIEEIHLVRSNIPEIGMHSFWTLPTLEVLNLRENNISTILDQHFRGLPNLERLYLDDNRIDRVSSGTFKYLTNLRLLSLTKNRLDELVTRIFEKLSKLQELNLSENYLEMLNPEVFKDIQDLKIFQCRSCALKLIDNEVFRLIPQLTILDLGDNMLHDISNEFHNLPNLISLWLDRNKLESLHERTFAAQNELRKLNIARNAITKLSINIFENVTQLMDLDLSFNKLFSLDPNTFQPFARSLQTLDLSGNPKIPVLEIKNTLEVIRGLRHFGLSDMNFVELPLGLFDFNSELYSLNLAGNHFVHFPVGALSPIPQLKELNLSRNRLRSLDATALLRLEAISITYLHQNKWACDLCHILPVLETMNRSLYLQELECYLPRYLHNKKVGTLKIHDLKKCSNNELYYEDEYGQTNNYFIDEAQLGVIAAGAGLLLLIITVAALLAGVCYSRRHTANYYTHEEKRNMENDPMFDNTDILFGENGEINFKFPMEKKVSIATIDEIKKDPDIQPLSKAA